jgi:hypothetical protein
MGLGKYSVIPKRGDTVGKMLDSIRTDYASTWITGWVPTLTGYTYQWRDPLALDPTPAMTLYQEAGDAIDAGVTPALGRCRITFDMGAHYETPEANGISAVGQDPATRRLVYTTYQDAASQEPTTLPADRPRNWRGKPVQAVFESPLLTTESKADDAAQILVRRLAPGRTLIEWESDLLIRDSDDRPLWITDVVRIMDTDGVTVKGDYRILAIPSIDFIFEASGRLCVRHAVYRGHKLEPPMDFSDSSQSGNIGLF